MPSTPPAISRRRVLVGAATLALAGVAASACAEDAPPPVDPLQTQLDLARRDSDLAAKAAPAAREYSRALSVVAHQRADHARAIDDEINRAAGRSRTSTSPTTPTTSSTAATTSTPPPPPSVAQVVAALRESAKSAADLAVTVEGYRAGLLGSVSACCAAAVDVALTTTAPAS